MTRRQPRTVVSQMQRAVRLAEADARADNVQDVGTGYTILRLHRHQPPLRTLLEAGKIGAPELAAAEQIELAVVSVASRGRLAAALLERVDHGKQGDNPWPAHIALAVRNYQDWANHWSAEHARTGNPMLSIIWDAVIDERPISVIADEAGYTRLRIQRAIVSGLRHYAAWVRLLPLDHLEPAQYVFDRMVPSTRS